MFRFSTIFALAMCLFVTATAMAAGGNGGGNNNQTPRSLLDRPINLPAQAAGPAQQVAARLEMRRAARQERRALKRLDDNQLRHRARQQSDRMAQLVLAERLAEEAQRWANVPGVGNDALSEALEWYAIAAKRGTPGTSSIDGLIPTFPIKALRD